METHLIVCNLRLKPGDCIKVKGKVTPEAKSFSINLGRNENEQILHFYPQFECLGDGKVIMRNSMTCGEWGKELRESKFPFHRGGDTKLCVSFTREEVMVKLHREQEIWLPNCPGAKSAEFFSVNGDFKIKSIKFD